MLSPQLFGCALQVDNCKLLAHVLSAVSRQMLVVSQEVYILCTK